MDLDDFAPLPTQLLNRERLASFPKHPVKVTAGDGAGIRGGAGTSRGNTRVWSAGGFPPAIHRPSVGVPRAPACATGKVRWPSLGHGPARRGQAPRYDRLQPHAVVLVTKRYRLHAR